jgi:hypothetical protein
VRPNRFIFCASRAIEYPPRMFKSSDTLEKVRPAPLGKYSVRGLVADSESLSWPDLDWLLGPQILHTKVNDADTRTSVLASRRFVTLPITADQTLGLLL